MELRPAISALVNHAPDAAALAVATGMRERNFVVADDAVVEVRDVERAVGSKLRIDRTEPRIVRRDEVRQGAGDTRGAVLRHAVTEDAAGHHVAEEHVPMKLGGPEVVGVDGDAINGRRAAHLLHHRRDEAEAVVRFSEARIVTASEKLEERFAVAVGGIQAARFVEGEAEGIHLAVRVMFNARTIEADAVAVAGIEIDVTAVARSDVRVVVESVRGVEPAVEPAPEAGLVAVRVARGVEGAVKNLALVGFVVAIGVFKQPDVRDGPDDDLPRRATVGILAEEGIHADGDVQSAGELGDLARTTVGSEVLKDHEAITRGFIRRRGPGIFDGCRDPQPALRVEGEVHRLVDVRLGGDELNLEARRKFERLLLVGWRMPRRWTHALGEGIGRRQRGESAAEQNERRLEAAK